LPGHCMKWV